MTSKATLKYLSRYAEATELNEVVIDAIEARDFGLVIPAYKEQFDFIERLSKHADANQILLVLVVNEPEHDKGNSSNRKLIHALNLRAKCIADNRTCGLYKYEALMILCVYQTEELALPAKQGVGLARKIGADLVCRLYSLNKVSSPWIFSSDADATLSPLHFKIPEESKVSAYYYPFRHTGQAGDLLEATQVYEKCLLYYQQQLKRAGSPYAFHTLGSAMAIAIPYYCQVRGFPKRTGGEDFYLFNKLAKLAPIKALANREILLQARLSDRVPFGTGPAVKNILEKKERGMAIKYYSPKIFDELQSVLSTIPNSWEQRECMQELVSDISWNALLEAGFQSFLSKRKAQDKNAEQFRNQFHLWFDGFQTLKFIHRLQTSYPDLPIEAIR